MTTGDLQLFTETHLMWCSWWSRELWPFNRSYKWASCFSLNFLLNCMEINHVKIYLHILNAYINISTFSNKSNVWLRICLWRCAKWTGSSIFSALTEHSNGFIHLCLIHPFTPIHTHSCNHVFLSISYFLFNIYYIYSHTLWRMHQRVTWGVLPKDIWHENCSWNRDQTPTFQLVNDLI